ncbi:MAG: PilZ domain-containing protein [Myxococcales bacterium]|nr:PilZ domain-containing protein [Myxococcales bacterium]
MSQSKGHPDEDARRKAERVTINKEFDSFDAFVSEYVTNVSSTGVFIRTQEPLEVGSRVNMKFTVVMDGFETVEGEGEVVRVVDDPPGVGVVFTKLEDASQRIIERLLVAQRKEGQPEESQRKEGEGA